MKPCKGSRCVYFITDEQFKLNPFLTVHHRFCASCNIFLTRTAVKRHCRKYHLGAQIWFTSTC